MCRHLKKKNSKKPARYYRPKIEIKGNNVKINGTNVFDQSVNSDTKHMEHLKKFQWSRRSLYICMLTRLIYSKEKYKMIPIDLSKQQTQDADPKSIKQTNVTENIERTGTIERFFILKKEKKT